jgi:hypothetical protein
MPHTTVAFSCRIVAEAQEAIRRLSALTRWSQPRLIEAFISEFQDRWLARFSHEERRRYEAGPMNYVKAFDPPPCLEAARAGPAPTCECPRRALGFVLARGPVARPATLPAGPTPGTPPA